MKFLIPIALIFLAGFACQPEQIESKAELTTVSVQHIEYLSYSFFGKLSALGAQGFSQHGFCWSESVNPDLHGLSITLGPCMSEGEFSCSVTVSSESTSYYVRAFAVFDSDTLYGNEISFTSAWAAENSVKDVEGNLYRTVQLGGQIWMAQNLRVTQYADKTPIPNVKDKATWFDFSDQSKAYCYYDNEQNHFYTYGALYTWAAATNGSAGSAMNPSEIQGVCPDGWHLPSDSEWKELEIYLGMDPEELDLEGWRGDLVGGKMKREGNQFWENPNAGANNESGFDALPGGYRHGSAEFLDIGTTARFWTSSKKNNSYGWYRRLDYDTSAINRFSDGMYRGHSVRCVKDD